MDNISAIVRVDLLVYSIIINIIMYFYLSQNGKSEGFSVVLFRRIIASTILVSIAEAISWSTGEFGNTSQIAVHYWSNVVFLANIGLTAAFGLGYLDYKIFGNAEAYKKRIFVYLIPTYLNIGFAVFNHFSRGFLFNIDHNNVYTRGIAANVSSGFLYVFAILVVINFYKHKKLVTGRVAQAITIYVFVPILGSVLQMLAYGTTFGMPAYTLASFLTFLLVEKDEMARDPLTQLYTRANLENRLRYKLKSYEPFTVILIDLNDFKLINDTYGHLEGDRVLQKVSEILTHSINVEDMVCRYGGDEFFILIENSKNIESNFIEALDESVERYNRANQKPYDVKLSYGMEYVADPRHIKLEALIHRIDQEMYEDKIRRKQGA